MCICIHIWCIIWCKGIVNYLKEEKHGHTSVLREETTSSLYICIMYKHCTWYFKVNNVVKRPYFLFSIGNIEQNNKSPTTNSNILHVHSKRILNFNFNISENFCERYHKRGEKWL